MKHAQLLWPLLLLLTLSSCSTYRGQNRVQQDLVKFPGGVYGEATWDDTLVFKRQQFLVGATLFYDVLSARLERNSPFMHWLGDNREQAVSCPNYYVFMVYRNLRSSASHSEVFGQLEEQGARVTTIPEFERNIRSHIVANDLHFLGHRARGVCLQEGEEQLSLILPGFKQVDLL